MDISDFFSNLFGGGGGGSQFPNSVYDPGAQSISQLNNFVHPPLSGLLDKLNDPGLQKQLTAAAGTPTATPGGVTPVQPIQTAAPNYSGTGPNAGLLQGLQGALNPSAPLSTAGGPAPLGPAAINPLLMLLRARLGVQ